MEDMMTVALNTELLSTRKVSQVLGCSPKTVQDWLYKDRKNPSPDPLPYYRINGLLRFRLKEVLAWVDRRRVRFSSLTKLVK